MIDNIETDVVIMGAGPDRPVRGVRARPPRHQGPPRRHPAQDRRPMRRALSGEADLRHPRLPDRHRPGPRRQPAAPDRAVQADLPSRRDGRDHGDDRHGGGAAFPRQHRCRQDLRLQEHPHRGGRRLVPAEEAADRQYRRLRGHRRVLRRAQDGRPSAASASSSSAAATRPSTGPSTCSRWRSASPFCTGATPSGRRRTASTRCAPSSAARPWISSSARWWR